MHPLSCASFRSTRSLKTAVHAAVIFSCAGAAGLALPSHVQAGTFGENVGQFDNAIANLGTVGESFIAQDPQLGKIAFAFSDINPGEPNNPITMTLYQGAGFAGSVVNTVAQTLPAVLPGTNDPPVLIDFDFSGTSLTVGQTYTAAVTAGGNSFKVAVVYSDANPYTDGSAFTAQNSLQGGASADLNFRVTPSAAPEPASLLLLGVSSVALLRRRRA